MTAKLINSRIDPRFIAGGPVIDLEELEFINKDEDEIENSRFLNHTQETTGVQNKTLTNISSVAS